MKGVTLPAAAPASYQPLSMARSAAIRLITSPARRDFIIHLPMDRLVTATVLRHMACRVDFADSVVITLRVMFRRRRMVHTPHRGRKAFIRRGLLSENSPAAKHHAERDDYTGPSQLRQHLPGNVDATQCFVSPKNSQTLKYAWANRYPRSRYAQNVVHVADLDLLGVAILLDLLL